MINGGTFGDGFKSGAISDAIFGVIFGAIDGYNAKQMASTGAKIKQSTISSTTEDYLVPVYKVMCLVQNVRYRGFRSLENQEFTFVNDWFSR